MASLKMAYDFAKWVCDKYNLPYKNDEQAVDAMNEKFGHDMIMVLLDEYHEGLSMLSRFGDLLDKASRGTK